ncbi:MAG: pentapeptide repeat-containing protein [Tissierellales bacterium]|nr:pentapeptide repeat-containing protein [Tissierellales bacterium]
MKCIYLLIIIFTVNVFSKQHEKINYKIWFPRTLISEEVRYIFSEFEQDVYYMETVFKEDVYFYQSTFKKYSNFISTTFQRVADFEASTFQQKAAFSGVTFLSESDFHDATFLNSSKFCNSKFFGSANFEGCKFSNNADFSYSHFHNNLTFENAEFRNFCDFKAARFDSQLTFINVKFYSPVDFRFAEISRSFADFSKATIMDTIYIGNAECQRYDFKQTFFRKGARIVICDFVDLQMQIEKIRFLELDRSLDYFKKNDITNILKENSFKDQNDPTKFSLERFELEYFFKKSTLFQSPHEDTESFIARYFYILKNLLYYVTMGFGYRPFILAYWVLGLIVIFGGIYFVSMPTSVRAYLFAVSKMKKTGSTSARNHSTFDNLFYCLYFSSLVFFTIKLKLEMLTYFKSNEKKIIAVQWSVGIVVLVSFLTLSKSGSILSSLKTFF